MPNDVRSLLLFGVLAMLAPLASPGLVHAADAQSTMPTLDDNEIEEKYVTKVLEEAAKYRLNRSRFSPDAAYEKGGAAYLEQARAMLASGESQSLERTKHWLSPQWWFFNPSRFKRAQWLASDGFVAYPYSQAAGDLLAIDLSCSAKSGDIAEVHNQLFALWFFLPDYAGMPAVMETAMASAERVQDFAASVNLDADDPRQVIRITGESSLSDVNKLLRFLVLHGDRETIAPRAAIGLARSLLRSGDRDEIFLARREYEKFCETYPTHDLVFTALCERALSYLVSYRGNHYDVGVLINASTIINQAEIESRGKPENIKLVEAYRKRIRSWHQDRDLEVARWYRDRILFGLGWLMCPGDASDLWLVAARFYFREVIRRDSASSQARLAQRELDQLPPPTAAELGAPVTPAKP